MSTSGSAFKTAFIPQAVNVNDANFQRRLKKLEGHLQTYYNIEELPNGWKCTSKAATQHGFVVTPESVLFVMKNLGI